MLFLPDAYIYPVYVRQWTKKWWARLLYFLPTLLLIAFMVTIMSANDMKPSVQPLVGTFMVCLLAVCVPKSLFAIIDGIGHLQPSRGVRRTFRVAGMCLSFLSLFILGYGG